MHPIATHTEWLEARKALLAKEKELTRLTDQLAEERRRLPWERVDKSYVFDTTKGKRALPELFEGRSQLAVYHFMFGPDEDAGCKSCSFWADSLERNVVHLAHRDVTLIAVSRGPLAKLTAYARRLGWTFEWVSSGGNDFNHDLGVSFTPAQVASGAIPYNFGMDHDAGPERPGISVFTRGPDGAVYHTYSCYARGIERMNAAYGYLDLVPKGRDEDGLPHAMAWVRRRDDYGA